MANKEPWNIGEGLPNVIESLKNKLSAASYHIECGKTGRAIINIDTYEHTILTWALQEYEDRRTIYKEAD